MVARSPSSSVFSSLISSSASRFRLIDRISFWYSSNSLCRNFCVFLSSICRYPPCAVLRNLRVPILGNRSICLEVLLSTHQCLTINLGNMLKAVPLNLLGAASFTASAAPQTKYTPVSSSRSSENTSCMSHSRNSASASYQRNRILCEHQHPEQGLCQSQQYFIFL